MSNIAARRNLLKAAQALAKTNRPDVVDYEILLLTIAQLYEADTGAKCECLIRVRKDQRKEPKP